MAALQTNGFKSLLICFCCVLESLIRVENGPLDIPLSC
ncbi:hypothetical protein ADICYQ_1020 [Cyclobacterium qasimii M12-11B]|uniref:Uncharacterized protein n=1 Tax=Cyclobacterium qasimii M12-11B TaxID=641524 RepID=S7VKH2_9BACT|nr:hypothetical protein ADICYQ_1020 [Cyclobacterium qasimii M12-11B]